MNKGLLIGLLLVTAVISAQSELPIRSSDSRIQPLARLVDTSFQQRLETELMGNREWAQLLQEKKMAVGVVDLSDPEHIRFARINGLHMMYAASLPKIAILLAAMDALEKGELKETAEVRRDMRLMISKSR